LVDGEYERRDAWGADARLAKDALHGKMIYDREGSDASDGAVLSYYGPRLPMTFEAFSEKVSEKPQKNHWKETTPIHIMERYIMLRAFFRRRRPE
jgi:hypothetical protein